jgi:DNA-binding winged helix-turn-helix (wHTH) protein
VGTERVVYEIGDATEGWELDPARGELRRGGEAVPLRPKPFSVLLHLVLHRDRFVSKEELLDALWPGVTVSETALTTAVKAIRRALDDDGESARFIETKRGRGYRFAAEVREARARRAAPASHALVGRDAAVAALAEGLDAALAGRGGVIVVRGEAGIGKTRLLAEGAASIEARGVPFATAWCAEESAAPPFWPWLQLLRALDAAGRLPGRPELADAREAARPLLEAAPAEANADDAAEPDEERQERFRLFDGAARLLRAAAEPAGLALVLDDLHAADDASLRLLAFVARQLQGARILLVAAVREPAAGSEILTQTLGALARLPHGRMLELSRLAAPEARLVAHAVAGAAVSEGVLEEIVGRADGNPFYLRELASAAAREPGALPPAVRDALRARIARLPERSREALAVGAVVGEEFAAELVARVLGVAEDELATLLAPAVRDGLVRESSGGHRFDHALIAETVRAEAGRARLMRLHLRVGEALERGDDADPDRLARHFTAAAESAAARAVEYSRQAGHRALQLRAFENAAAHFERALRALELEASPDLALRGELLARLGEARNGAGEPLDRVASALDEAIEIARRRADGEALARALRGYQALSPRRPDLLELHEEALRLRAGVEDATTVGLLARLAIEHHFRERPGEARAHLSRSLEVAERLALPAPLTQALTARLVVTESREPAAARLADAERVIAESVRVRRPVLGSVARWKIFFIRLELGDPAAGREVDVFARHLDAGGNQRQRPSLLRAQAALAFMAGELDAAHEHLREALAVAGRAQNPAGLWASAVATCLCTRERGDPDATAAAYLELRRRVPRNRISRFGLVDAHVRAGRIDDARAELGELDADEVDRAPNLSRPLVAAWLAEACRSLREPGLAELLSAWLEPALGLHLVGAGGALWLGAASRHAGLLAWAGGRLDAAEGHLRRALAENDEAGAALPREHARCDLARVLLARGANGDRQEALSLLAEAERWAGERPVGALQQDLRAARLAADKVIPLRGRHRA